MRHVVAVAGIVGALVVPSSAAPDNRHFQREIVGLRQQLAVAICHVAALERAAAVRPAPVDANGAPANMPPQPSAPCASLPEAPRQLERITGPPDNAALRREIVRLQKRVSAVECANSILNDQLSGLREHVTAIERGTPMAPPPPNVAVDVLYACP